MSIALCVPNQLIMNYDGWDRIKGTDQSPSMMVVRNNVLEQTKDQGAVYKPREGIGKDDSDFLFCYLG